MERIQRRDSSQWESIVREQAQSGQSAKEFCSERSVGLASFYHWRKRFRAEGKGTGKAKEEEAFIEVISSEPAAVKRPEVFGWEIALDLGDGIKLVLRRC